MVCIDVLPQPV